MKKLHVVVASALIVPALTFGIGSALAEQRSTIHGNYLSSQPANSFRADEVIGSDMMSRVNDEAIGTIGDLLIGEDGQVMAVIVDVGGLLGMGTKEVAIAWDSVEHARKESGEGYEFSVHSTEDTLKEAPEYDKEASSR
ncbi:MAG: PRC-barrel domain containing protein [Chromatiaceae bacterium]|nr:MAG: PRC-barrel domain containing protein [Chromatiaceae bacterium]